MGDYDPHLYRQVENPTTNFDTLTHLLKGSIGTGILAMPEAFSNSGYINGFLSTIFFGILTTYCLHILVRSQYILCKRYRVPLLTYPISMKLALEEGPPYLRFFSSTAVIIVDGFLVFFQTGACCVYMIFVAENIKQIFDEYVVKLDLRIHLCILFIPFLLMYFVKNLKVLSPFSSFANLITFVGLGILLYYIFRDIQPISKRAAFVDITRYPLFVGTTLFALVTIGVITTLENNMKTPKAFRENFGVLNVGMFIITTLYTLVGFLGYLTYGEDSKGSVTLNVPQDEILSQTIKLIMAVAIFISYALQGYVAFNIVWNNYLRNYYEDTEGEIIMEYAVRALFVIITFVLSVAIPKLGPFISLIGAFCLSVLGFLFPAILEICVLWPDEYGIFDYTFYKDILIGLFAIFACITGVYVSIREIVITFGDEEN